MWHRHRHQSPLGASKFNYARPEELQRLAMMTAIQFVLFEPHEWVEGSKDFKVAVEKLIDVTSSQLKWLKEKYH